MFSNIRSLIFKLDPEAAHNLAIKSLKFNFVPSMPDGNKDDPLFKTELFGKNGLISSQFKNIGSIPETDRKKFASDLNQIKDELQNLITNKINDIESKK